MTEKLITLDEWAKEVYGEHAPCVHTLRRWAREARIYPAPQKHGRSYFVTTDARYLDPSRPPPAPQPKAAVRQPTPPPGGLVSRLIADGHGARQTRGRSAPKAA